MKVLRTVGFVCLTLCSLFSCGNKAKGDNTKGHEQAELTAQTPNIVFILSDDQSWTDYSFMGDKNIETPRIDQFAKESLAFTRSYVPTPLCSPSLATIITGLYPKDHGILGNDKVFERIKGDRATSRIHRAAAYTPIISAFEKQTTLPDLLKEKGYISFQTGFLWYAPFLPHRPHNPPQRLFEKYQKKTDSEHLAKYWAMCEWFDETCGQLFDLIEEKGLTENTLFVYVCDNGWAQDPTKSGYLKHSKRAPYDMGIRTPIMYKWKGKITPKMDNKTITSSIDMVPTVLDILGIEKPENLPGINVLEENALQDRNGIFGEVYAHDFDTVENSMYYNMAIFPPYKIIIPDPVRKKDEVVQLFNIDQDPFEKKNIAANYPEIVEKLTARIKAFRTE